MKPSHEWVRKAFDEIFEQEAEADGRRISRRDKARLLKAVYQQIDAEPPPPPPITHLELLVSEECNLRCDYCFVENKNPRVMSPETGRSSVDFLLENCGDKQQLGILFFGGEPLLGFHTIRAIVDHATEATKGTERQIRFSMTTNGTLFTQESLAFCKEHKVDILLSVDGMPSTHNAHRKTSDGQGSYEMLEKKLPLLFENLGPVPVRMTPHPDSVGSLSRDVEHLLHVGFRNFTIGPAHGLKWSDQATGILTREMGRVIDMAFSGNGSLPRFHVSSLEGPLTECDWGCRAGRSFISVGADGDLGPCSLIMGTSGLREQYTFGDIQRGMSGPLRTEFLVLESYRIASCTKCEVRNWCQGGCPGNNYKGTGSIITPDPQECEGLKSKLHFQRLWHERSSEVQEQEDAEIRPITLA